MSRSHLSLMMTVQVLVTHAHSVATMEREMGHPPRIIRAPGLCDLFAEQDQTVFASPDERGPNGTMDAPRELEASFEEIER